MLLTVLVPMGMAAIEALTSYTAFIHFLVDMTLFFETFSADITNTIDQCERDIFDHVQSASFPSKCVSERTSALGAQNIDTDYQ